MRDQSASKEDRAAEMNATYTPRSPWRVSAVTARDGYRFHVRFLDGSEGIVDLSSLIMSEQAGVFAELRDEEKFRQVSVEAGAVTWPNGLDLAPDAMYRAIRATGSFTPGTEKAA